ncbi:MAG TPA: SH3 domain-containing protein [Candidatus Dojkabacteria bacterium]|nr:SH3 domain-containing protein [Candidatus Dojkabacteria bacterium]
MNIHKKFSKLVIAITILMLFPLWVFAFPYYSVESQEFDTTLSDKMDTIYTNPTKIYITQVTTGSEELSRDPATWVKAMYYYSITRLYLSDIPYTYLLDESGLIYQGTEGGIGANPQLKEVDGAVIIGYLSNNTSLTNRASDSLYEMVEDISSNWGISSLSIVDLLINQQEGQLSTISARESSGDFANSVREALVDWKGYEEENLEYKARIEEIEYEEEIPIGERLKVRIKMRNMNDFIWFTDKDPIYVSVKDGEESEFAINQEWDSFTKPASISDKNILPGETAEVEFNLEARVFLGEASESFEILKFENEPFENSDFEVKFNITRGDKQLVEVDSVRYGFVNIRDCRWYSCEILDSADNGAIFILEGEESGWSRIRFGVDQFGWVNSAYLKKI